MTRRILLLVLIPVLAMIASSCDDTEINTPGLQIVINGELFKAEEMVLLSDEEGYTIQGVENDKKLSIHLSDIKSGTYALGEGLENSVHYVNEEGVEFTTDMEKASGEVMLTYSDLDGVTGTFYFQTTDTSKTRLHAHNGHIYQVPFGSEDSLPDFDFENEASFSVNGEEVEVTEVEVRLRENTIELAVIAENNQRLKVSIDRSVEVGTIDLPSTEASIIYLLDGESEELTSGTFEVLLHEPTVLQHLKAKFEGETEDGNQVTGAFQVSY